MGNAEAKAIVAKSLDVKRYLFVQYIVRHGMDRYEAYRAAFGIKPDGGMSQQVLFRRAEKLWKSDITRELYKREVEAVSDLELRFTAGQHLMKLRELRDRAVEKGDLGTALRAEVKRGEVQGLYVQRVEAAVDYIPSDQLARELKGMLNANPELLDGLNAEVVGRLESGSMLPLAREGPEEGIDGEDDGADDECDEGSDEPTGDEGGSGGGVDDPGHD